MSFGADLNKNGKTVHFCAVFPLFICILLNSLKLNATNSNDSIATILPEIEIFEQGKSQFKRNEDGSVEMNASEINKLSRSFGEADMLGQIRQLSNVNTSSDYSSGMVIDGNDPTQIQYFISSAPVIYPYRFGGIFSTFNTSHFSKMTFRRQAEADALPRLGSSFVFSPDNYYKKGVKGIVNVGMLASSATIKAGVADKLSIILSGRISYIDQLYSKLLKFQSSALTYQFFDINAGLNYKITAKDIISADFFTTNDKLRYDDSNYNMNTAINWRNTVFNLKYIHDFPLKISAAVYYSGFSNVLNLGMSQIALHAPTSFKSIGVRFKIGKERLSKVIDAWEAGLYTTFDKGEPQSAELLISDSSSGNIENKSYPLTQKIVTSSIFGMSNFRLVPGKLNLKTEASIGIYNCKTLTKSDYNSIFVSPRLSLNFKIPEGHINFGTSWLTQPIHQVGFSELGLASNFWIGACHEAPMQKSFGFNSSFKRRLPFLNLDLEISAYWKWVENQPEYSGQIIEVIELNYNPFSKLIISDGYNYGFGITLSKNIGFITGEINYSFGDGKRHIKSKPKDTWNALMAEGHNFKAGLTWHEGKHWEVYASFRLSSGRRYTPVASLYAIGGNIAMEYGKRNSARLPLYQRLDLGGTYYFTSGKKHPLKHLINLSLINAYGHKNVEMQYFILSSADGSYHLKKSYSLYRFLPSLSYSIEF